MKKKTIKSKALLIVADSCRNADLFYAVTMYVGDPFIFFQAGGKKYIVMSDLEIDRARKNASVDRVLSLSEYQSKLKNKLGKPPQLADIVKAILRDYGVSSVEVPSSFPLGLAEALRQRKVRVAALEGMVFPERETKSDEEVRHIRHALRLTSIGLEAGIETLRKSKVGKGGYLYHRGRKLTSEHVRSVINTAILWHGGEGGQPIVAGGLQACDPHEVGHGPLRAHEAIILDIFPRATKSGYHGDMTRTVVKGRASEALKKLYATVHKAQKAAVHAVRAGVDGQKVHGAVQKVFDDADYKTGCIDGRMQGFFHGTGHGLGLEVHEPPRVSSVSNILKSGHVVTIEPGLYYPSIGGVRIEDVVRVTKSGAKMLSSYPYRLEI